MLRLTVEEAAAVGLFPRQLSRNRDKTKDQRIRGWSRLFLAVPCHVFFSPPPSLFEYIHTLYVCVCVCVHRVCYQTTLLLLLPASHLKSHNR